MVIDPQLHNVVNYMMETETSVAEKLRMDGGRPWMNFAKIEKAGKFQFDKVHKIFTRQALNDEYGRLRTNPESKTTDIQTVKISADFLAGCERDFKMRSRSRIRMLVHAGVAMAAANGNNQGPLRRNSLDWLGRVLAETGKS